MKKIFFLALFLLTLNAKAAIPPNGSFETGNLTGWTTNDSSKVAVVTSYNVSTAGSFWTGPTAFTTVNPTDGNYFAVITAGSPDTTLTSSLFSVGVGDLVNFDWAFSSEDYMDFNDFGQYAINFITGNTIISAGILSMVSQVGDYGYTGWQTFSFESPLAGIMKLQFASVNVGDNLLSSKLLIDNVHVGDKATVPEPTTILMIGLGFVTFGLMKRKGGVVTA